MVNLTLFHFIILSHVIQLFLTLQDELLQDEL